MRRLFALPISLLFILLMTACTQKKEEVLLMIQASSGKVTGNSSIGYTLTHKEMHDTVIWFSNRPNRKAGSIPVKDLLKAWDEGKDSFKKDPPNAILVIANSEPVVVELVLITSNGNKASFQLTQLEGQEHKIKDKSGPTTIYIDGLTLQQKLHWAEM